MNDWTDTYPLAGFIIGNGYTDPYSDSNVLFPQTLFNMNMISWQLFTQIQTAGCVWYWDKLDISPHKNGPECDGYWQTLNSMLAFVNIYDLYRTNYADSSSLRVEAEHKGVAEKKKLGSTIVDGTERTYKRGSTAGERTPWLRSVFGEDHPMLNQILGDGQSDYLNRADVRQALNIPSWITSYEQCNNGMYITYQSFREGSVWIYPILKEYGYRLMHYSGDTDGAIPTLGTRKWISELGWDVTQDWRPWTTNGQISGYLIDYDNFQFATVHGVGHMAPQWKREDMTDLIMNFIHKQPIN